MASLLLSLLCLAQEEDSVRAEPDSSDFITASLLIMQPDPSSLITYYGHTAMRLQCPSAGLDYCFSFDSYANGDFWALITGKDRTTLLPVASSDFFRQYRQQHRKVYEHELNLTLEEERRLWQLIDHLVEQGPYLQTDFLNHGCAGETASIITSVIDGRVVYPTTLNLMDDSQYEIIDRYMTEESWYELMLSLFSGADSHRHLADNEEKLMLPTILEMIWKETSIVTPDGGQRPIFAPKDMKVYDAPRMEEPASSVIRPWVVAALLLVLVVMITVSELCIGRMRLLSAITDGLLLAMQSSIGLVLSALMLCSTLPTTGGWNWNIIVYNLVPLAVCICWLWRQPKARTKAVVYGTYSVVLIGFFAVMLACPMFFVQAQYFMHAAMLVRCLYLCYINYNTKTYKFTNLKTQ